LAIWPGEEVRVRYLSGVEKLAAFQSSVFVPMALAEHAERFGVLHAVMERVPLLAIERPAGQRTLSRVVEAVLHG
jgi:hypothetical protein